MMWSDEYLVEQEGFWNVARMYGGDGYDIMAAAERKGWFAISAWGEDGWDLGDWPYAVVYWRNRTTDRGIVGEMAIWVEGDLTCWAFPDRELRDRLTDETAFFYWKSRGVSWVEGIDSADEMSPRLRGRYRGLRT